MPRYRTMRAVFDEQPIERSMHAKQRHVLRLRLHHPLPFHQLPDFGSVDIPWGIIELVLWRTALQADTYVFGFIRAHLHFVPMYTGYSW